MRLVYRWLGSEIMFAHIGHGLLGVGVVVILAFSLPWWFFLALLPLVAFSLWFWFKEASFVMPVARRYLSGKPFPEKEMMTTATTRPDGPMAWTAERGASTTAVETFRRNVSTTPP